MVIAPGTLGMTPVTSLGLVSGGWRKAYQKCHWRFVIEKERNH